MDLWHPNSARLHRPDAVHEWAALEAKSETMREDLVQRYAAPRFREVPRVLPLALISELITAAIAAVLHARSR
jgi:hypothetical protein